MAGVALEWNAGKWSSSVRLDGRGIGGPVAVNEVIEVLRLGAPGNLTVANTEPCRAAYGQRPRIGKVVLQLDTRKNNHKNPEIHKRWGSAC